MLFKLQKLFTKKASKKALLTPPEMARRTSDTKTFTGSPESSTSTLVDPPPVSLDTLTFLERSEKNLTHDRYKVFHDASSKHYDLKVSRTGVMDGEERAQALQETDAFAAVKGNPSFVDMLAHWDDGTHSYQVTEHLPHSLKDVRRQGPLNAGRTQLYAAHLVLAIEALHVQGIAHNEFMTSNIRFTSTGRPVVGGMSKAKLLKPLLACDGDFVDFNASDHAEGGFFNFDLKFNAAEFAADSWGLGTCLYEMATGRSFSRDRKGGIKYRRDDRVPRLLRDLLELIMGSTNSDYKTDITTMKAHPYFSAFDWNKITSLEAGTYSHSSMTMTKPQAPCLVPVYSNNIPEIVCDWDLAYLKKLPPPPPPPPPPPIIDITDMTLDEVTSGYTPGGRESPRYFPSIEEEELMIGSSLDMD